ncbi:type II toxin-antitoxin system VapC family toxin [Acidithiobacillus sp. IBUN Pt1247-S3]|uniref:type II toxin-antitoxin system VapC family toxin n=1 Tax=Acidithiobacillus sp. IBUN Pt1247-S3 TaxID=3166642 RepID=UPI0034E5992C
MRVYFDSSAFAKRYIQEAGTDTVLEWCQRANEMLLSVITVPEIISALCRLQREVRLSVEQYHGIKQALLADISDALICEMAPPVIQRAVHALEQYPLRGMDAIHVGAALAANADRFLSADQRQCLAAQALGLNVVVV